MKMTSIEMIVIANDELRRIRQETIVAYFKTLFQFSHGTPEEYSVGNYECSMWHFCKRVPGNILNSDVICKSGVLDACLKYHLKIRHDGNER